MYKIKKYLYVTFPLLIVLAINGCEDPQSEESDTSSTENTIDNNSSPGNNTDNFSEYYYNFDNDIDVKFIKYSRSDNTINNEILLGPEDTLNFKTFPDYLLRIEPDQIATYQTPTVLDETNDGACLLGVCSDGESLSYASCCNNTGGAFSLTVNSDGSVDATCEGSSAWTFDPLDQNNNGIYESSEYTDSCQDVNRDGVLAKGRYEDIARVDSVTLYSTFFKNIERMSWATDVGRYKEIQSDAPVVDTTLYYIGDNEDLYDSLIYVTVIDTLTTDVSNLAFYDTEEYVSRDSIYTTDKIDFSFQFEFEKSQISVDSLMYMIDTDCNNNNVWDAAEIKYDSYLSEQECTDADDSYSWDADVGVCYTDTGNGIWDDEEPYLENPNLSSGWDLSEPFKDFNCNESWDAAETKKTSYGNSTDCEGAGFSWDTQDSDNQFCFEDSGNGVWDDDETFADSNDSGDWDSGEKFYTMSETANQLIIDYSSGTPEAIKTFSIVIDTTSTPNIISNIFTGAGSYETNSITDFLGNDYDTLITVRPLIDLKTEKKDDIDSIVTTYSNQLIENLSVTPEREYYIAKSQTESSDPANAGLVDRDYAYHMLKIENNGLYSLIHPSYFMPFGYYTTEEQIEDGFWFDSNPIEDILFYTNSGNIRENEYYFESYQDTTPVAIYNIEKSFKVDFEESVKVQDQDYSDVYKITRITYMIMLGTGVEYAERTVTWLGKGVGVIMEQVDFKWGQPSWDEEEIWTEYSRIELSEFRQQSSGSGRTIFDQNRYVGFKNVDEVDNMFNDPYVPTRTSGMQIIRMDE